MRVLDALVPLTILAFIIIAVIALVGCAPPSRNMRDMSAEQICHELGVPEAHCIH